MDFTLLLGDDSNVYSLGCNTAGQCGHDPQQQSFTSNLHKISAPKVKKIVAQSTGLSILISPAGELYFFGAHPGINGLVGHFQKIDTTDLGESVLQIICGISSAAALTVSRQVMIWGESQHISSDIMTPRPTPILELKDKAITQLSGIGDLFVFVNERGRVYMLGSFGDWKSPKPQIVRGRVSAEIIQKSSCSSHDILLLSEIGDVFQWNGSLSEQNSEPQFSLISLMEDKVVIDICSGLMHSVLLTSDGLVYCLGSSEVGQLGIGHKVDLSIPVLVHALQSTFVTQIAAGRANTAVLTKTGEVYIFGLFNTSENVKKTGNLQLFKKEKALPRTTSTYSLSASHAETLPTACKINLFSHWAIQLVESKFQIVSKSHVGSQRKGGDIFRVVFTNLATGKQLKGWVTDKKNGTYLVTYIFQDEGFYEVRITLNGAPVGKKEKIKVTSGKKVTPSIDISNLGLTKLSGTRISLFEHLNHLDISNNLLTDLPAQLAQLKSLTYIDMSHNSLQSLPANVAGLPNLTTLKFHHNPVHNYYSGIAKLKSCLLISQYITHVADAKLDLQKLNLFFKYATKTLDEGEDRNFDLCEISSKDLPMFINIIEKFVSVSLRKEKSRPNITITPFELNFGMKDDVLPVNKQLSEEITIRNSSNAPVKFSVSCSHLASHDIEFEPHECVISKKSQVEISVSLKIKFSSRASIKNAILIEIEDFVYPIPLVFLTSQLYGVVAYEEVDQLVKNVPPFAKSKCPLWKVQFRGMPCVIKGLFDFTSARNEVELHKELKHPNICQLICHTPLENSFVYIILPEMAASLDKVIHDTKKEFPWERRLAIAIDVAKVMNYVHLNHVVHRDLKPANLLLDDQFVVKLTDFGESKEAATSQHIKSLTGTKPYIDPIFFDTNHTKEIMYSNKIDVYSFGIILWEMSYRKIPYWQDSRLLEGDIFNGKRPSPMEKKFFSENYVDGLFDLILECWDGNPEKRPLFSEIAERLEKIQITRAQTILPQNNPNNNTLNPADSTGKNEEIELSGGSNSFIMNSEAKLNAQQSPLYEFVTAYTPYPQAIVTQLEELGVSEITDIVFLREEELMGIGIKPVQARKMIHQASLQKQHFE